MVGTSTDAVPGSDLQSCAVSQGHGQIAFLHISPAHTEKGPERVQRVHVGRAVLTALFILLFPRGTVKPQSRA